MGYTRNSRIVETNREAHDNYINRYRSEVNRIFQPAEEVDNSPSFLDLSVQNAFGRSNPGSFGRRFPPWEKPRTPTENSI